MAEPTEPSKSFLEEFKGFIDKYGVIGLAVAFVIGAAVTKLVTALVQDIIMPIVSVLIPGGAWRTATWNIGPAKLLIGEFAGALIDFLVVAFVVFLIVKSVVKEKK
jgi:large conductance mechanosensitive channel